MILTKLQGSLNRPDGTIVTSGRVRIKLQQDFMSIDGVKIAPFSEYCDIAIDGSFEFYLSATSNNVAGSIYGNPNPIGVVYILDFDPTPSDQTIQVDRKSGYFRNICDIPHVSDDPLLNIIYITDLPIVNIGIPLYGSISGGSGSVSWNEVLGKPSEFTPSSHDSTKHSDWPSGVSMTEVGYLSNVTSDIQTQISSHSHSGTYEPVLGNPLSDNLVLASSTTGTRSWVAQTGGVSAHGSLTGLSGDDHTQYHTDARGDARYSVLAHDHTGTYLGVSATASDSDKLDGQHGSYYAVAGAAPSSHALTVHSDWPVGLTTIELGYVDGVTSSIQSQIDGKSPTGHNHSGVYEGVLGNPDITGKVLASTDLGVRSWVSLPSVITDHTALSNIGTNSHSSIDTALTRLANTSGTNTGDNAANSSSLPVGGTAADSDKLDGQHGSYYAVAGAAPTSHTLTTHSDWPVGLTTIELGYVDGVTSSIQSQIDGKSSTSHDHNSAYLALAGTAADSDKLDGQHGSYYAVAGAAPSSHALTTHSDWPVGLTTIELGYVDGVTSGIQGQIDGKSATSHNHDSAYLTIAGTAADSDKLDGQHGSYYAVAGAAPTAHDITAHTNWPSGLTATELGYVDGVTSGIQSQIDGKASSGHNHSGVYEPVISSGTTGQYWRGDKSWQDLPTSMVPTAHQLDGALHTVSGLTPGSFLKATGADTFGFASHGLTYTDVGAASSGHTHAQLHDAATVADTASLDLTITGQQISGSVLPAGVDHNSLANLTTGNPHTQYLNATHQSSTAPHVNYRRRTGFASRTDNTISLSTRTVTNAPTGTSFKVYSLGTEYTKTSQSVTFANTAGLWFVYYGLDGVIAASQTPWVINGGSIPICAVYWNGTAGAVMDERHGYERDLEWHYWAHHSIGSRYHSGLAGTFSAGSTFSITAGKIMDEDLEFSPDTQTTCRMWYRSGGVFTFDSGATAPYKAIAGALQYDNAGDLAAVGSNRYITQWVYATGDTEYPIWIVVAQATHATIAAARAEAPPETQTLPAEEAKLLYGVIYRQAAPATWQETQDYRNSSSGPAGTFVPTDHGTLSGLADDDHPQYHNDTRGDARYSLLAHNHSGVYEPVLGNPSVDGYALVSTTSGVRSWAAASGGGGDPFESASFWALMGG